MLRKLFCGMILSLVAACSSPDDLEDDSMRKTLAALSSMVRTAAQGSALTGLAAGNPITSLQADDLEPGVYTIQFTVLPPSDGAGFAAYAIINWKIGGQQLTRKVSVYSGAVISGVAEAVDVKIVDVSQIGTFGFPTTALPYQVGASLSKGSRANTMQPATLLTQLTALPIDTGGVNPNSRIFLVPADSGIISVLPIVGPSVVGSPLVSNTVSVVQLNQASTNLLASWYPILQPPGWIPLLGGTVNIGITTSSANTAIVNVIWGIEG